MPTISIYEQWKIDGVLDDKILLISAWYRDGLDNKQVAHNLGIGETTLKDYKKKYPLVATASKTNKEIADIVIENSLYKRAKGYKYDEVTKELTGNKEDGYELKVTKIVTKEVAPDTTAQIYWLKNRKPVQWNDRKESAINTDVEDLTSVAEMLNTQGENL